MHLQKLNIRVILNLLLFRYLNLIGAIVLSYLKVELLSRRLGHVGKKGLIRKIRLISKFVTSQPG